MQSYEVIQLLLARMSLVVLIMGVALLLSPYRRQFFTPHWRPMCLRGVCGFFAFALYYIALQDMPLADGATLLMTAPLFVTVLSVPLLGERVGVHRWAAVCTGFVAIVVMLQPSSQLFKPISALPLLAAMIYALVPILARKINADVSALVIAFFTTLTYWMVCILAAVLVLSFPAAPDDAGWWAIVAQPWPAISLHDAGLVIISALFFCAAIVFITLAYRTTNVSVIASFEYSYIVWATLMGYLFFGDVPAALTWIAGAVITACGVYIALRERRISAQKAGTKLI